MADWENRRFATAVLSLVLALLPVGVSGAVLPLEQIASDLASHRGVVVQVQGERVITDLGGPDGVSVGDLVVVLGAEQPITHPTTGETLGSIRPRKAVLRLTRVTPTFSTAQAATQEQDISRGDTVARFARLAAWFVDATGEGESAYRQLRETLPALEWQGYRREPLGREIGATDLLFQLKEDRLDVRDGQSQLIRRYRLRSEREAEAPRATPPQPTPPAAIPPDPESAGYGAEFPSTEVLGSVTGGVQRADFAVDGNRLLMAVVDENGVSVYAVGSGTRRLASLPVPRRNRALALNWWQPEGDSQHYLAVTTWNGDQVTGMVLGFDGRQLTALPGTQPLILGTLDRDGDGRREQLLGQSFDHDGFFGRRVVALQLQNERLISEPVDLEIPRGFVATSATLADVTGDGEPELAQVHDDTLRIFSASGEPIYASRRGFGGSLSGLTYETEPSLEFSPVDNIFFEHPPLAVDVDGDGVRELLAIGVDRQLFSAPGMDRGVDRSWLTVLDFRNGQFVEGRLGPEFDVPIQGLTAREHRILLLVPGSHKFFTGAGDESSLLALPWRSD